MYSLNPEVHNGLSDLSKGSHVNSILDIVGMDPLRSGIQRKITFNQT